MKINYMTPEDQEELCKYFEWNIDWHRRELIKIAEIKNHLGEFSKAEVAIPYHEREIAKYQRMYNSIKPVVGE